QPTIDLLDDARQLEGHLRLSRLKRAVLDPGGGAADGLARRLLDCATVSGTRALGLTGGALLPGSSADFCTIALDSPVLAGADEAALLAAVVFSAGAAQVKDVWV